MISFGKILSVPIEVMYTILEGSTTALVGFLSFHSKGKKLKNGV